MRIFVLEDDPLRQNAFMRTLMGHEMTICDSVLKAKQAWNPPYDVVCLDHDLGGQQMVDSSEGNTGTEFAGFLRAECEDAVPFKFPGNAPAAGVVYIHSYNPAGAARMEQILWDCCKVVRIPFGLTLMKYLEGAAK